MNKLLAGLACASLFTVAAPTIAAERASGIEEIVVTATKREESVQDIPIAVSAFNGDDLTYRGIDDVSQLQQVSPSLLVNSSNSTTNGGTIRIRGIGTTGNNVGLESAVGFFQDGIYISRSGQALNELLDVERVEVLRGPQGTLFGKNTSAGAVSIISKEPEFDFGGNLSISGGNLGAFKTTGGITGPVMEDVLAFRLAGMYSKRDGFMDDIDSSDSYDERDRYAFKGQLLFTPTDTFEARLFLDYMKKKESCCPATYKEVGPTGAALRALGGNPVISRSGDVGVNSKPYEDVTDKGTSLNLNWDLGWAELVSISSYRKFEVDRGQDVDFSNVDIYQGGDTVEEFKNWSQELRLVGTTDSLDWIVGAYAGGERIRNNGNFLVLASQGPDYFGLLIPGVAPLLAPGNGLSGAYKQNSDSWALYTNNTVHLDDQWSLTFGARYTQENKHGGTTINGTGTAGVVGENWPCASLPIPTFCDNAGYNLHRNENKLTGTLKLGYAFNDDLSVYGGWSNGYKAGGFNLDPTAYKINDAGVVTGDAREFEEETVNTYEIGMKSQWFDGILTLNTAAFWSRFEDFQLNTFNGAFFTVDNVPEVTAKGIEVEYTWLALDGVMLTGGVTYTDSRYTAKTPIVNATAAFGGPTDLKNQRLTNAPYWQTSTGVLVDRDIPFWDGYRYQVNLNWLFRGDHNTGSDLDPQKRQGAYSLVNGQIGVRTADDRYELLAWGTNLFDKQYRPLTFDAVSQTGSWSSIVGAPRMYGLTLKANF